MNDDRNRMTFRQWDPFFRGKTDFESNKIFLAELARKFKDDEAIFVLFDDMPWEEWQEPIPLSQKSVYGERLPDGRWKKIRMLSQGPP